MKSAIRVYLSPSSNALNSKSNLAANAASTDARIAPRKTLPGWVLLPFVFIALMCIFVTTVGGCAICGGHGYQTDGTIVITSIRSVAAEEGDCTPDPVRVNGDFTTNYGELVPGLPVGDHLPRAWVESIGMTIGSRHPATYVPTCGSGVILNDIDYVSTAERDPVPCTSP